MCELWVLGRIDSNGRPNVAGVVHGILGEDSLPDDGSDEVSVVRIPILNKDFALLERFGLVHDTHELHAKLVVHIGTVLEQPQGVQPEKIQARFDVRVHVLRKPRGSKVMVSPVFTWIPVAAQKLTRKPLEMAFCRIMMKLFEADSLNVDSASIATSGRLSASLSLSI
jgi:hypothetical protein